MQETAWRGGNACITTTFNRADQYFRLVRIIYPKYNNLAMFAIKKPRLGYRGCSDRFRDELNILSEFHKSTFANQAIVTLIYNPNNVRTWHKTAYISFPVWISCRQSLYHRP